MRYIGPRNRIARREGIDLGLKTPGSKAQASLLKKMNIPPGQHGAKGKRKSSEHSRQLREKQKLRFSFGVTEGKMKKYFEYASRQKGNTGLLLSQLLEKRLDNILYRLGFAPTRASARQLVNHKNVKVNNTIMSIPSYEVKVGDSITFSDDKIVKIPEIEMVLSKKDAILPAWLEKEGVTGKLIDTPSSDIIEKEVNLRLVVEFYSR